MGRALKKPSYETSPAVSTPAAMSPAETSNSLAPPGVRLEATSGIRPPSASSTQASPPALPVKPTSMASPGSATRAPDGYTEPATIRALSPGSGTAGGRDTGTSTVWVSPSSVARTR